jgi:7-carboxy-7-deazaguanine synthase
MLKVCEIFTSIQGETTHSGLPCTFVRFTGCNLRCSYCDTVYAYDEGREYSDEEILAEVSNRDAGLVAVTGGEPLLQAGVPRLVSRLIGGGYKVLVETNGTLSIKDIDPGATVVMDIKAPGSGMSGRTDLGNLGLLKPSDEVKFVLTDRWDYEWAREFIMRHGLDNKCIVLLSPAYGVLKPDELAEWMLKDRLRARLNLQLHKYLFGPDKRGV